METSSPDLPFLSNIGLMLTYKCTIACPHCIVEAGPHRTEEMPLDDALDWIDQASRYRNGLVQGVALTGGEPFYNLETLARVAAHGRALGLLVSAVTNAYWAPTVEAAVHVLAQLPDIHAVSFSTDVYHQRAIPLDYIKNAILAARALGRPYNISVVTDNEQDPGYLGIVEKLTAFGEADRIRPSITFPVGRARHQARRIHYHLAAEPTVAACTMAGTPVIFPNGAVNACIGPVFTLPPGHPLYLGNLHHEPLADMLDGAEENLILHTIRVWGPHRLVQMLKDSRWEGTLPGEYICNCICDTCYKMLSNPAIVAALASLLQDRERQETVAWARVYYLGERTLVDRYNLLTPAP